MGLIKNRITWGKLSSSKLNLKKVAEMQAYSPFKKYFETLSYLPQLSNEDIKKQIDYMIKNHWTPSLEFSQDGDIYLNTRMGPGYYDNRDWSMYKLPMYGTNSARDVIDAIESCRREFPQAKIRVMGFDSDKQVQSAGFIVAKGSGTVMGFDSTKQVQTAGSIVKR